MFTLHTTITQNDYFKVFGISLFTMNDDLMQDDINLGDLEHKSLKDIWESSQELKKIRQIKYSSCAETSVQDN